MLWKTNASYYNAEEVDLYAANVEDYLLLDIAEEVDLHPHDLQE